MENVKKQMFVGGVRKKTFFLPYRGGGAQNVTDMTATYVFFYAFPKQLSTRIGRFVTILREAAKKVLLLMAGPYPPPPRV